MNQRVSRKRRAPHPPRLEKSRTGIAGFDELTHGGLPRGRTTLLCGGAGCGKTLFGMQFLVNGIAAGEHGVFVAFEEGTDDLAKNVASLGFDLAQLVEGGALALDHIRVERAEIEESGEYSLDGVFLRLQLAIESVGAQRVVIDTLETLFGGLTNTAILRSELKRLFEWLKAQGVTAIVTAERGDGTLTRHGLEEYVSDCVVLLDHRVDDQVSTRRVRVVKYRGSTHGTNEYPFLIDAGGIHVMPITSHGLEHVVYDERVSTGVADLDAMFEGAGYHRGSTILVSGTAGSGKSSLAAHFADATCRRDERCIYFSFEESPEQIKRNMRSIGLDLGRHDRRGLLRFHSTRPTSHGVESHLALMHRLIAELEPRAVVVDPIGALSAAASVKDAQRLMVRMVDLLKTRGITALLTSLTHGAVENEATEVAVSSLVDTWLLVRALEGNGERNRGLYVLKSRGTAHSNQIREFIITPRGIELVDVYLGEGGVLTGAARQQQEARERAEQLARAEEMERRRQAIERKRDALEQQIAAMRAEVEAEENELARLGRAIAADEAARASALTEMAAWRSPTRNKAGKRS